jgi:hypothetical protein
MLAFEIQVNGKRRCVAGTGEPGVLSAILTWHLGEPKGRRAPTEDMEVRVGGLTLDQKREVVEAQVDRMPKDHAKIVFDSERWKKRKDRIEMVRSLPQHTNLMNQGTNVVLGLLGPPDGESVLRDAPWELRIDCPSWSGFDVFFYWPTGKYPGYIYGGSTERIGDWVYVHE